MEHVLRDAANACLKEFKGRTYLDNRTQFYTSTSSTRMWKDGELVTLMAIVVRDDDASGTATRKLLRFMETYEGLAFHSRKIGNPTDPRYMNVHNYGAVVFHCHSLNHTKETVQ